jgi:hypothetical protein
MLAGVVGCLLTASSPATAARATPLGDNLVRNAGAERGPAAYPESVVNEVPGWSRNGNFTVVPYTGSFMLRARRGDGVNHFYCGFMTTTGAMWQDVRLIGRNRVVDARRVRYQFSVDLGAWTNSRGRVSIRFLSASRRTIRSRYTRWVPGNNLRRYRRLTLTGIIPAGSRTMRVVLSGNRTRGLYCSVAYERVRLTLARR